MREYQELLVSSLSGEARRNFDQPVNRIESQSERSQRAHAEQDWSIGFSAGDYVSRNPS